MVAAAKAASIQLLCPRSWRENIAFLEADDDIHYSLIALHVLEQLGDRFAWNDIADACNALPLASICTVEAHAILNYNTHTAQIQIARKRASPVSSNFTCRNNNPYREWIDTQIRADVWGYAYAGHPERATSLAWRDASWTHKANGIYAAMMMRPSSPPRSLNQIHVASSKLGSRRFRASVA